MRVWLIALAAAQATLVDTGDPGMKVMQSMAVACPLTAEVNSRATAFLHHGADYYKFMPVARWAENTLEDPATSPTDAVPSSPRGLFNAERASGGAARGGTCPTAPKVRPCLGTRALRTMHRTRVRGDTVGGADRRPFPTPQTFLNSKTCARRKECVSPPEYSETKFVLDETMARASHGR
jgi:hypothetical protein